LKGDLNPLTGCERELIVETLLRFFN